MRTGLKEEERGKERGRTLQPERTTCGERAVNKRITRRPKWWEHRELGAVGERLERWRGHTWEGFFCAA